MICPHCRLYISNPDGELCPRCRQPLFERSGNQQASQPPPGPAYRPAAPAYRTGPPASAPPTSRSGRQPYDNQGYGDPYERRQPYDNQDYSDPSDRRQPYRPAYGRQPYADQGYDDQGYDDQGYDDQGYDNQALSRQPFQRGFAPPAPQTWGPPMGPVPTMPPRKTRRARRVILWIGLSVSLVLLGMGLCVGAVLVIGAHQTRPQTNTVTPTPFPGTSPGATILFQDALTTNTNGWVEASNRCFFRASAYHVANNTACYAPAGNIGDANITVQAKQVAGSLRYAYGIVFRRASTNNWYEFDIDGNSEWTFIKVINQKATLLVNFTRNTIIKGGLNTVNTLLVQAKGAHFTFYVNGTQVGTGSDTAFTSGQVGLSANGNGTEAAYTTFQITAAS